MVEWTVIIVCKTTSDNHNQVDKCPDAEAPAGEQLKNTAHNTACVEAMHAERPQKLAKQYCRNPAFLHPHSHHRPWIVRLVPLRLLPRPRLWRLLPLRLLLRLWIGRIVPLRLFPRPRLLFWYLPLSLLLRLRLSRIDGSIIAHNSSSS